MHGYLLQKQKMTQEIPICCLL